MKITKDFVKILKAIFGKDEKVIKLLRLNIIFSGLQD